MPAVLGYVLAVLVALALGFRAVSHDDYARVTIAQFFAVHPQWDPSGTSWLPFPFWLTGSFMMALGRSLLVARAVAFGSAAASGALLYAAGRCAGLLPSQASVGALLPLSIPLVTVLTAATVPELLTAALTVFSLCCLIANTERDFFWAALAICVACLSRYEPWPVAGVIAVRLLAYQNTKKGRNASAWAAFVLSLLGPIGWILWNLHSHADAWHFVHRVAAYQVHSMSSGRSWSNLVNGYPRALFQEGGVLLAAALVVLWRAKAQERRRWLMPLLGAGALLVGLLIGQLRAGVPTHDPERALVAIWMLASVIAASGFLSNGSRWWCFTLGGAALVFGALRVAPLRARLGPSGDYAIALGRELARVVPRGERVLFVPESDEYFATVAAFGRPEDIAAVILPRVDPRVSSVEDPFASWAALVAAVRAQRACWVVAFGPQQRGVLEGHQLLLVPIFGWVLAKLPEA